MQTRALQPTIYSNFLFFPAKRALQPRQPSYSATRARRGVLSTVTSYPPVTPSSSAVVLSLVATKRASRI
jgi:hypothetical protein